MGGQTAGGSKRSGTLPSPVGRKKQNKYSTELLSDFETQKMLKTNSFDERIVIFHEYKLGTSLL